MTEALPAIDDCSIDSTATLFHREPAVIGPITATLIQASIAASTRRAYRGALGRLDAWLGGRVLDDHALSEWITVLHDRGLSVSSASLAVGAARFRARMAGLEDPAGPLTLRTLAGIRRSSIGRGRGQVSGVTWEEADLVVDRAMGEGTIRGLRDAALIAVGSDALLRVGEMVAIDVRDIERDPDGSAVLHVRRSKTDQEETGATCYLGRRTVEVLDRWMAMAGIGQDGNGPDDPMFRSVRKGGGVGDRLSCRSARSIVIRRCGGGNERISGHSLRVGSAISLARAGASLVELQQAGRWKSPEMPARYTRGESARRGPVARLRHGQVGERRREAGDCPGAGGISGRPWADTAQGIEQESGPDDGLTPGIRFNGARAGNSAVPMEACEQARPCSPVSSPGIGEPASGGLIGTYKQEGPMSNRQPVRGERGFFSFRHVCLPWGLGASLVPLNRIFGNKQMKTNQPESHSDKTVEFRTGNVRAVLAVVYLSLLLAACGSVPVEPRSPAKVTIVETTTVVEKGTALTREKPEIEAQGRSTAPVTDTKLCECWHESLESVLASASWYESLIFGQEGDGATCFTRCTCPSSPLLPEGGTMGSSESWVVVGEWGLYKGTVNSEDRVFTLLSPDSKLVFMEERDSLVFQDGVLMNRYEVIASGTDRKCS